MTATAISRAAALLLVAALAAGCGDDPVPHVEASPPTRTVPVVPYDPATRLEPAAAVLPLVPLSATSLTVTDFDEVRKQLGVPDLTSADPMADRSAFWEQARTDGALLAEGLLRADSSELMLDRGFTQDDVDWEAHFTGDGEAGWVLAFRPDLDMSRVAAAVRDRVGPLAGATVLPGDHLVVAGVAGPGDQVWASDPAFSGLAPLPAESTYLHRGCLPFDATLGADATYDDQQAVLARHDVTGLDALDAFAVAFGDHVATVRLGAERDDLFERLELGETWPETDGLSFPRTYRRAVGDPTSGRIGYDVPRPAAATALAMTGILPFGICNRVEPMAEPTGL